MQPNSAYPYQREGKKSNGVYLDQVYPGLVAVDTLHAVIFFELLHAVIFHGSRLFFSSDFHDSRPDCLNLNVSCLQAAIAEVDTGSCFLCVDRDANA
jgi:hypothetical protein